MIYKFIINLLFFSLVKNFQTIFKEMSIKFIPVYEDLIDLIWTKNRAPLPNSQIYIQPLQFAGTCTIELSIFVHLYN